MQVKNRGGKGGGATLPSSWQMDKYLDLPLPEAVPGGCLSPQSGAKIHPHGSKERPPQNTFGCCLKREVSGMQGKTSGRNPEAQESGASTWSS